MCRSALIFSAGLKSFFFFPEFKKGDLHELKLSVKLLFFPGSQSQQHLNQPNCTVTKFMSVEHCGQSRRKSAGITLCMFIFAELWPVSFANRPDSALYGAYASAADPVYPPTVLDERYLKRKVSFELSQRWPFNFREFFFLTCVAKLDRCNLHLTEIQSQCKPDHLQMCRCVNCLLPGTLHNMFLSMQMPVLSAMLGPITSECPSSKPRDEWQLIKMSDKQGMCRRLKHQ